MAGSAPRIAVVVPCFRVRRQVLQVIGRIGLEVERIYAVDDFCPEQSGALIEQQCTDPRVRVLRHAIRLHSPSGSRSITSSSSPPSSMCSPSPSWGMKPQTPKALAGGQPCSYL